MAEKLALNIHEFETFKNEAATVLDLRPGNDFAQSFIPDSINIELDEHFNEYSKYFFFKDQLLILICENGKEEISIKQLQRLKFTNVRGYLAGGFKTWIKHNGKLDVIISIDAEELELEIKYGSLNLYDIRNEKNFSVKHVENSENIDLDLLIENTDLMDSQTLSCFYCEDGKLSMSLISYLRSKNIHLVYHVKDGFKSIQANPGIILKSG